MYNVNNRKLNLVIKMKIM